MPHTNSQASIFQHHRSHVFNVAYRMLGTVSDAEDLVQETYCRWQALDTETIDNPRAYLGRVTTRLAIDLRSARVRREQYVGPWLPEPIVTSLQTGPQETPESHAALSESLSMAFLVVLESLTPTERAAFLLREVFDYDYAEVAAVIEKSEANTRQIVHRAKARVRSQQPRFEAEQGQHQQLVTRFVAAVSTGDVAALEALLADDIVMTSDGGGKATAARKPIVGAAKVGRFFLATSRKANGEVRGTVAYINGRLGVVVAAGGDVSVFDFDSSQGQLTGIRVIRNPDKLAGLDIELYDLKPGPSASGD